MLESELVWAIQQISEELGKTSGWDIASVVISGISVILTVAVLVYNHKAIKLTQQSVQQAVNLQLFEKRLELYNALAETAQISAGRHGRCRADRYEPVRDVDG